MKGNVGGCLIIMVFITHKSPVFFGESVLTHNIINLNNFKKYIFKECVFLKLIAAGL